MMRKRCFEYKKILDDTAVSTGRHISHYIIGEKMNKINLDKEIRKHDERNNIYIEFVKIYVYPWYLPAAN